MMKVLYLLLLVLCVVGVAQGATVPLSDLRLPHPEPLLIPLPQEVIWSEEGYRLTDEVSIIIPDQGLETQAVRDLQLFLREVGLESRVVSASHAQEPGIRLVEGGIDLPAEGYQLVASPQGVTIQGADPMGVYWGVQTLRQLILSTPEGPVVSGVEINDWPDYPVRGLHMFVSRETDLVQLPIVVKLMPKLKLNTLVLQVDFANWDSNPELWNSQAATKAQMARVAEAAREHHIEFIPLVNLFGHMDWAFLGGKNLHFVASKDSWYAYDPTNPASYEFAERLLAEVIEFFNPRYINIGHDEIGRNIPTGGKPFGQVFVEDVQRLHGFLAEHGVGTMIWADEVLQNDVFRYVNQLPKDIVMVYWWYGVQPDYADVARLRKQGFPVHVAAWYEWDNIEALARLGHKRGAEGALGTTWAGFYPGQATLVEHSEQYAAYVVNAEIFWNLQGRDVDSLPYDPGEVFRTHMADQRPAPRDQGFAVDLQGVTNADALDALGKPMASRNVSGINTGRGAGQLIAFTPAHGRSTGTNQWGYEVTVEDGRITRVGGNNHVIPTNGMVLSGHEAGASWLKSHAPLGADVQLDGVRLTITGNDETEIYRALASQLNEGITRYNGILFDLIGPRPEGNAVVLRDSLDSQLPIMVEIPLNEKAETLWFLQSATKVVRTGTRVASYTITYADGETEFIWVTYGKDLIAWDDISLFNLSSPLAFAVGRRSVSALEWKNPRPEKEIASITFRSLGMGTSPVLLAITGSKPE